jgi:hypothetical protein
MVMRAVSIQDVVNWHQKLIELEVTGACEDPNFLKPFHFVMLGLAILRIAPGGVQLADHLRDYANRMRLWEACGLAPPNQVNERDPAGRFVPLNRVVTAQDVDIVATELMALLQNGNPTMETRESIEIMLLEILGNAPHHMEDPNASAMACGQLWVNGDRAQFAIADNGIGLRNSLARNPALHQRLQNENSCALAAEYGITSKPGCNHSGYGLTLARDLARKSNGVLLLISGNEAVKFSHNAVTTRNLEQAFPGFLAIFEWKLSEPLSCGDVYGDWPLPEGLTNDDLDM